MFYNVGIALNGFRMQNYIYFGKKNENISSRSEDIKKSIFRGFGDVFPYLGVYEI